MLQAAKPLLKQVQHHQIALGWWGGRSHQLAAGLTYRRHVQQPAGGINCGVPSPGDPTMGDPGDGEGAGRQRTDLNRAVHQLVEIAS